MRIKLTLPKDQGLIEEALSVAGVVTTTDAGIQSDWGSAELGNAEAVLSLLHGEVQGRRAFVEAMEAKKATAWVVSQFLIVDGIHGGKCMVSRPLNRFSKSNGACGSRKKFAFWNQALGIQQKAGSRRHQPANVCKRGT